MDSVRYKLTQNCDIEYADQKQRGIPRRIHELTLARRWLKMKPQTIDRCSIRHSRARGNPGLFGRFNLDTRLRGYDGSIGTLGSSRTPAIFEGGK